MLRTTTNAAFAITAATAADAQSRPRGDAATTGHQHRDYPNYRERERDARVRMAKLPTDKGDERAPVSDDFACQRVSQLIDHGAPYACSIWRHDGGHGAGDGDRKQAHPAPETAARGQVNYRDNPGIDTHRDNSDKESAVQISL
jgi:hypothetical protein